MRQRTPAEGNNEPSGTEICAHCGRADSVAMSEFRWNTRMHVAWRCPHCNHVWATPKREPKPH